MIINLEDYRKKKNKPPEYLKIPVYERIYMEDDKIIGECSNGYKEIIKDNMKKK